MKTELYWVEGPWSGRLAIMPRPRGGDWLEDEVRSWRESGIDVVVSLLTAEEIIELNLTAEEELCRKNGMELLSLPIPDRGVPLSLLATSELLTKLADLLTSGKNIAIHCRQGIGRAGLIASALLASTGINADSAIQRVSTARGCSVPETPQQREWVSKLAQVPAAQR
jgi:protein-tyrosine phosphatase